MELLLLVEAPERDPQVVVVETAPGAPSSALVAALGSAAGIGPALPAWVARTGHRVDGAEPVHELRLRDGDCIRFSPTPPVPVDIDRGALWELHVIAGPLAGSRFGLREGIHVVGRDGSAGASLVVPDPAVSRRHLRLVVTAHDVRVRDLGSTNGARIDGMLLEGDMMFEPGSVLELGSTLVSLERTQASAPGSYGYDAGRLVFNRPPRVSRAHQPPTFTLPKAPAQPDKPRLPLAASIVPVAVGLVMFAVMKNTMFLLFMALGPAMAVFSWYDSRRTGTSSYKSATDAFRTELAEVATRIDQAHRDARRARRHAAPNPAVAVGWAIDLSPQMWERRASDDDFLALRVGTADQPTVLEIVVPAGGDEALLAEAVAVRAAHAVDADVPVIVELRTSPVAGICGSRDQADSLLRWLVLQASILHSPAELAVVALLGDRSTEWRWLSLLPHTASLVEHQRTVAVGSEGCRTLIDHVVERLRARRAEASRRMGDAPSDPLHLLIVVEEEAPVDASALTRLLGDTAGLGVSAILRAERRAELHGACSTILEVAATHGASTLTDSQTGGVVPHIVLDEVNPTVASQVALALAPVRDNANASRARVPSSVRLRDLLGPRATDPAELLRGWRARGPLEALVGTAATGPVRLDLRHDGPHALVAGTTGSGKSELLQSWVASLAVSAGPDRLSFLLIDYKGGASFKDCVDLPHTVGFVTDLDAHLAHRVLDSLEAELARREMILRDAGAKDLVDLERVGHPETPPSLVIFIDEFAFLRKEVPEFVAGVVDIAQRGRSLGVHLILATQRPAGVVDDQVRANTNLRIALRVGDAHDSSDVVGVPDAAEIPRSLPGRALIRTGHAETVEVQTGYVGGTDATDDPDAVRVRAVSLWSDEASASRAAPKVGEGPTDLQQIVDAVRRAFRSGGFDAPRRPWVEPLREGYALEDLPDQAAATSDSLVVTLGVADQPKLQRQVPYRLDLAGRGHVLLYGTSGAGASTALRTIAASLASAWSPADVQVYGLDFGSGGLRPIEALPHCGSVIAGRDTARVERLFAVLEGAVQSRQEVLARSGAADLAELRRSGDRSLPYLVVLLDGYATFASTFEAIDHGALIDRLNHLVAAGRAAGVVFVITSARRSGVPTALASSIPTRVVLRMADEDEYLWLDVPQAKGVDLGPGRGFTHEGDELQVAVAGTDPSGTGQAAALARLAELAAARWPDQRAPGIQLLPERCERSDLPVGRPRHVAIGIEGADLGPATVDLSDFPMFLVAGPDRSGRSTAVGTVAAQLHRAEPDLARYLLAPRRSPLVDALEWDGVGRTTDEVTSVLADVAVRIGSGEERPTLLVIDDGDELAAGPHASALERCTQAARDSKLVLVVATQSHTLHRSFGGWLSELRKAKCGLLLHPDPDVDGDLLGVRLPRRSLAGSPPGRGYLIERGRATLIQVSA